MMKFRRPSSRQSAASSQNTREQPAQNNNNGGGRPEQAPPNGFQRKEQSKGYQQQQQSGQGYARPEQPQGYHRPPPQGYAGRKEKPVAAYSPRSIAASPVDSDMYYDMRRANAFEDVKVPISPDGIIRNNHADNRNSANNNNRYDSRRAASVGRSSMSGGLRIVGTDRSSQRSKSTERGSQMVDIASLSYDSTENSGDKKRKSKMEKIRQLQAKNELYKVEFKRVQKDRKHLKKDIEKKKQEMDSLTKEIDSRIAETSVLKLKLSEALQDLDRNDEDQRRDLTVVKTLSNDLSQSKSQLDQALSRAGTLKDDLDDMKEHVHRKDEQIENLTEEVSNQAQVVQALQNENKSLRQAEQGSQDGDRVGELQVENDKLQKELGSTLERAASMVKEREDAIADLLKENEEMKRSVGDQQEKSNEIVQKELLQFKNVAETANMDLEEAQDRTSMLEEDIEGWIVRSGEMEADILRLQDEVEAWQQKANAAQDVVAVVEQNAQEKAAEAAKAQQALGEMEARYKKVLGDFESKHRSVLAETQIKHKAALVGAESRHRAALTDVESRQAASATDERQRGSPPNSAPSEVSAVSSSASGESASDAQSRLLQQAVAARQSKDAAAADAKGSWRNTISGFIKAPEEEEELDENQKRIKELEALNDAKDEEIKKLKSETVRLSSGYKEVMYMNKKKIEGLTSENEAYAIKTGALGRQLAEVRGETPSV